MTTWSPDTCDCKIEYNKNIQWIRTIKVCRLHKNLKQQNLLGAVLAQNRRFNLSFGDILTENQEKLIILSKNVNKLRIRTEDLTNFDEELPFEQPLTFFQNLRKTLRL